MGCGAENDDAREPPVSISPAEPSADDAITVRAHTLYGRGDRGDGSNYHFNLAGPTGEDCRDSFESAIGMSAWERRSTERGGEVVIRLYYPTRADRDPLTREQGATWCPGTYNGAVEWRNPINLERRTLANGIKVFGKLIGTYSFRIPNDE